MHDWIVELVPRDARSTCSGSWLDIVRGDEQDGIDQLEFVAGLIDAAGRVPSMGDWRNESFASITRRVGRRTFAARVDCFEFETENGFSNGHAWLWVREAC